MNFQTTAKLQGVQGVFISVVMLLFPEFFLQFLSTSGVIDPLAIHTFRLIAFFVAIVSLVLLSVAAIEDKTLQIRVLGVNALLDTMAGLYILYGAYIGQLYPVGGYVLAALFIVNGISYAPTILKIRKAE